MGTLEQAGKRDFSVWKALAHSFFSKALYKDVGKNWKGVGFGYLFLVLALLCVMGTGKLYWEVSRHAKDHAMKIPEFKLEKGVLSVKMEQPFFFPDKNNPVLTLDTTGKVTSFEQIPGVDMLDSAFLLTGTKIHTRRDRLGFVDEKSHDYPKGDRFSIDRDKLMKWADLLIEKAAWTWTAYPFILLYYFVANMFEMIAFGLIGLVAGKILRTTLTFGTAIRLASVSHTPALVLSTVLFCADVDLPLDVLIYFLISTLALFFAVKANHVAPPPLPQSA
jgi:hypothetical protein